MFGFKSFKIASQKRIAVRILEREFDRTFNHPSILDKDAYGPEVSDIHKLAVSCVEQVWQKSPDLFNWIYSTNTSDPIILSVLSLENKITKCCNPCTKILYVIIFLDMLKYLKNNENDLSKIDEGLF